MPLLEGLCCVLLCLEESSTPPGDPVIVRVSFNLDGVSDKFVAIEELHDVVVSDLPRESTELESDVCLSVD